MLGISTTAEDGESADPIAGRIVHEAKVTILRLMLNVVVGSSAQEVNRRPGVADRYHSGTIGPHQVGRRGRGNAQ